METEKIEQAKTCLGFLGMTASCEKLLIHYIFFIFIILVFGSLGGIARGSYERLVSGVKPPSNYDYTNEIYKKRRKHFWMQHIFLGMAGGACAILLGLLLSKYELKIEDLNSVILYSCISFAGGIFSKRCIPILGDVAAKKLGEIQRKADEANQKADESRIYAQMLSDADLALLESDASRAKTYLLSAIDNMNEYYSYYSTDRHFCIRFGRMYRRMYDITGNSDFLRKAISILREYTNNIKKMKINVTSDFLNIATGLFNMACYHSLLIKGNPTERERLSKEAVSLLEEAFPFDSKVIEDLSDPDLKEVWPEIRKSKILNKSLDE